MSSTSAPYGFRPSFHNSGQMRPKAYTISSTYAANIFSGDPVKLTSDGVIQLGTSDGTRSGTTESALPSPTVTSSVPPGGVLWKCLAGGATSPVATISPGTNALAARYAPSECR